MSLAKKTLSGLFSTGVSKVALVGINLVLTGILARYVTPDDFGLIGMVSVFVAFLSMVGSLGFDGAIVQKEGITQPQLSTLFWTRLVFGCVLALLLVAASWQISAFYGEPRLTDVTQALAFLFVTSAVYQVHHSLMRKDLRFGAISVITVVSVVGSGILAAVMAFYGGGVWSLVAQSLALDIISCVLFWGCCSWKPSFAFDLRQTAPLVKFGLTMTGAGFTLYVQRNIDSLLIGKMLGAAPLGYYSLAYRIMYAPVRQISYVFTDVLFPSFSRVQSQLGAVQRGYLRSIKWIALVTFPAMTLVALHAEDVVVLLFGPEWIPAGTILAVLAPAGALQSVAQVGYVIYPVMNRPDLGMKLGVFNCVAMAGGVLVGARWGAEGAALGVLFATGLNWLITEFFAGALLGVGTAQLGKAFFTPILGCVGIFLLNLGLARLSTVAWFTFAVLIPITGLAYLAWVYLREREEMISVLSVMKDTITELGARKPLTTAEGDSGATA